jgi:hypothetical protein
MSLKIMEKNSEGLPFFPFCLLSRKEKETQRPLRLCGENYRPIQGQYQNTRITYCSKLYQNEFMEVKV